VRDVFVFQQIPPDPVMYLVDGQNRIVARNDDYYDQSSEIIYQPEVSGQYTLILKSFSYFSPGYCSLYRGVRGYDRPFSVDRDILFWGGTRIVTWTPGQVFETTNSTGDPFLIFLFADQAPGMAYFGAGIDDAGAGLNSRFIAPPFAEGGSGPAVGRVVLGSYSPGTQGQCEFCQDDPSAVAPAPREQESAPRSEQMQRLTAEVSDMKKTLEELEPAERDRNVDELRQKVSLEGEQAVGPPAELTPELLGDYEEYRRQSKQLEEQRGGLVYNDQLRALQKLESLVLRL